MNRSERVNPELALVGGEKENRKAELERLGINIFHFLKHRKDDNKEELVNLLYHAFCEMDEQFTGGSCTVEDNEEDQDISDTKKPKRIIGEFVESLPAEYGNWPSYKKTLLLDLCHGAMTVELVEQNKGKGPNMFLGHVNPTPEITDVFVGNKIYKPSLKKLEN